MNFIRTGSNAFVFVVCGTQEHIDTLHYSLGPLRQFSRSDIIVVTDSGRNESPVVWSDVVDIATPPHLDHHQASIYLKTSLHRILPTGPRYCYLDTDIIAMRSEVDDIFDHKNGPISFAADHSRLNQFSPHAIKCGCVESHAADIKEMEEMVAYMFGQPNEPAVIPPSTPALESLSINVTKLPSWWRRLLGLFERHPQSSRIEVEAPIDVEVAKPTANSPDPRVERYTKWTLNRRANIWSNPEGREVHIVHCEHLQEQIAETFGIQVLDANWQHWNGGVFLFDSESHAFLDAWHDKTMAVFKIPMWRTRDQGTLVATAWEFGLQNVSLLPEEFNFIVDYYKNPNDKVGIAADNSGITKPASTIPIRPCLIHVYYHFGDQEWPIWNWIEDQIKAANHKDARSAYLSKDRPATAQMLDSDVS